MVLPVYVRLPGGPSRRFSCAARARDRRHRLPARAQHAGDDDHRRRRRGHPSRHVGGIRHRLLLCRLRVAAGLVCAPHGERGERPRRAAARDRLPRRRRRRLSALGRAGGRHATRPAGRERASRRHRRVGRVLRRRVDAHGRVDAATQAAGCQRVRGHDQPVGRARGARDEAAGRVLGRAAHVDGRAGAALGQPAAAPRALCQGLHRVHSAMRPPSRDGPARLVPVDGWRSVERRGARARGWRATRRGSARAGRLLHVVGAPRARAHRHLLPVLARRRHARYLRLRYRLPGPLGGAHQIVEAKCVARARTRTHILCIITSHHHHLCLPLTNRLSSRLPLSPSTLASRCAPPPHPCHHRPALSCLAPQWSCSRP